MARPRSPEKRDAILNATARALAEHGLGASTSTIAKLAGVAEGTIFTYFDTKDVLLNELYLQLKAGLREKLMSQFPASADAQARVRHAWDRYLDWGLANPDGRRALRQLDVSGVITPASREAGATGFAPISEVLRGDSASKRLLAKSMHKFTGALFMSVAETAMEFIVAEPARESGFRNAGFRALQAAARAM